MYNRWRDKLESRIAAKTVSRRRVGFLCWPTDIMGWVRIPSLIAGIAGLLGILRYTSPQAFRLLKPLNLPSIEFCWVMLALGVAVYFLCLVSWLSPKGDATKVYDVPEKKATSSSGGWRSL
jgi:hypothetical protein